MENLEVILNEMSKFVNGVSSVNEIKTRLFKLPYDVIIVNNRKIEMFYDKEKKQVRIFIPYSDTEIKQEDLNIINKLFDYKEKN